MSLNTSFDSNDSKNSASHLRVVPRRRVVPGPRALVGGLLIAVAAVGTFATATGALASDTRSVVVANRDIAAGTRLTAGDVRVIEASIPADTARNLASSREQIVGTIALGPMKSGEIVQSGNVVAKTGDAVSPEISFAIPRARAVGGELRSGENVDVISTKKGNGESANAVAKARIVKVDKAGNGGIGSGAEVVVTLAVANRELATTIAGAVDQGEITLVRTTGLNNE